MQTIPLATAVVVNGTGAATIVHSPTAVAPTAPDDFTLVALLVLLSLAVTVAVVYGIIHLCRHIRQQGATLTSEMRNDQIPSDPGRLRSAPIQASQSLTDYHRRAEDPIVSQVRRHDVAATVPPARPGSVHLQGRNDHDHSDLVEMALPVEDNGLEATRSPTQPWLGSQFSVSSGSLGEVPSGWVTVPTAATTTTTHQAFSDALNDLPATGMNRMDVRSVPNIGSSRTELCIGPRRSLW